MVILVPPYIKRAHKSFMEYSFVRNADTFTSFAPLSNTAYQQTTMKLVKYSTLIAVVVPITRPGMDPCSESLGSFAIRSTDSR